MRPRPACFTHLLAFQPSTTSSLLRTAVVAAMSTTTTTNTQTKSSGMKFSPGNPVLEPHWSSAASVQCRSNAKDLLASGWSLSRTRDGLEREFVFRGFVKAMQFMNAVADECRARKHHPEWANVYNKVRVRWSTHNPVGLSDKDVEMARFCDMKAVEVGAVEVSASDWKAAAEGENVLERLAPAGSECAPCGGGEKKI